MATKIRCSTTEEMLSIKVALMKLRFEVYFFCLNVTHYVERMGNYGFGIRFDLFETNHNLCGQVNLPKRSEYSSK